MRMRLCCAVYLLRCGVSETVSRVDFRRDLTRAWSALLLRTAWDRGVIDMALLRVIRQWALWDQVSIRAISRRTDLSLHTIRQWLRSATVLASTRGRI